jgi:hypothetical protein
VTSFGNDDDHCGVLNNELCVCGSVGHCASPVHGPYDPASMYIDLTYRQLNDT